MTSWVNLRCVRLSQWLSTLLGLLLIVVPVVSAELPEAKTALACDSSKLHVLEEKLIAQGELLAEQQAQLAALQASLDAQVTALAQQKRLLDGMMPASARSSIVAEAIPEKVGIPRIQNSAEKEAPGLAPAGREVAATAFPRPPLPGPQGAAMVANNIVR